MECKSTRDAYGEALVELGAADPRVVVLDCDIAKATRSGKFAEAYPDRFFNCGVQEANMMNVAGGLALSGFIPFASTFAVFASCRAADQVRNTIAYANLNVKIGATHAGLTVGRDGASHQSVEDIAVMRAIPNMTVLVPCDFNEAKTAIKAAAAHIGPVYLRLGRAPCPECTVSGETFEIGKGKVLREGSDVAIFACGALVCEALDAVSALEAKGISVSVISMATVKPLDEDLVVATARQTGAVVVVEEHSIFGGLGEAISGALSRRHPVPVEFIGIKDKFGMSGSPAELLDRYELTSKHIVGAAERALDRKDKSQCKN